MATITLQDHSAATKLDSLEVVQLRQALLRSWKAKNGDTTTQTEALLLRLRCERLRVCIQLRQREYTIVRGWANTVIQAASEEKRPLCAPQESSACLLDARPEIAAQYARVAAALTRTKNVHDRLASQYAQARVLKEDACEEFSRLRDQQERCRLTIVDYENRIKAIRAKLQQIAEAELANEFESFEKRKKIFALYQLLNGRRSLQNGKFIESHVAKDVLDRVQSEIRNRNLSFALQLHTLLQ